MAGLQVTAVVTDEYDVAEPNLSLGLYVDLPAFLGAYPGELNWLGRVVRIVGTRISPWLISGGVLVVAQKPAARETTAETAEMLSESMTR